MMMKMVVIVVVAMIGIIIIIIVMTVVGYNYNTAGNLSTICGPEKTLWWKASLLKTRKKNEKLITVESQDFVWKISNDQWKLNGKYAKESKLKCWITPYHIHFCVCLSMVSIVSLKLFLDCCWHDAFCIANAA